ncbi:Non-reducing polyketide synthase zea1 [Fusarium graminearum]
MAPNKKTILLFGDQTDSWVDGIDRLYQDAASIPWLQSFLDDLTHTFKTHTVGMDAVLRNSLGDFANLQELAEKYRYTTDDVGMAQAFLIYAVRAGILLKWAKHEPSLLSTDENQPEWVGISGGLISLSVLAVAETFEKLYEACLEVAGLLARLCRFTSVKSRSMEDRSGAWGWTVLGIGANELRNALDQYQQSMSAGRTVSVADDHPPSTPPKQLPGRIAIVGMAGRGPGSDNVEEFWNVIMSKLDLCEEIPEDRFNLSEFYRSKHDSGCTTTTKFGCFMDKPGHFDNRFFHISPREALLMDPGHRQFLMTTYEALEMAGYSDGATRAVDPARIATFFGQCNDDWHDVSHHTLGCDAYTLQGVQRAFGAGRIAFQFKWEGPTYSLDSACASTASSIHLACTSLLAKETDMAVAGAANVVGYPHSWTSLSKSGVLSDTGNCKTFRDDADGYCRADFVGTVVLKRLEDAIAHNDNILAVVAASGRNHSGNSSSITTSDAKAQEKLYRKMMHNARVSPNDISYVEMHGTGTKVGDPAEMGALASLFSHRRTPKPVVVGGVKANVGHSESAAGVASLLKCIMMFQKNILPPQAGMPHALNPNFPPLSEINIEIPSEPSTFESPVSQPRRILLNNFDAAGGNACILLEDFGNNMVKKSDPRVHHTVVTSSRTQASYHGNKAKLLQWLRQNPGARIEDLAYTTTARRTHHPIRFAVTASSTQELISKLEADTADSPAAKESPVVFVFTGQGSHYAGMGSELYETSPVFRETVNLCATICEEQNFPPFLDLITQSDSEMSDKTTLEVQLAVLTLEIGLAALWRSIGIQPSVVIGHSLGEYAALHVSGVLSLADVLYLVGQRALLILQRCEVNTSAMLSVAMPVTDTHAFLEAQADPSCEIACVNSTNASVISGSIENITELQAGLKARSKMLSVPYGFHSSQMDPILADYAALAGGVTFSEPKIPVASTLLASLVDTSGTFHAGYMARQCRQPVNFVGALEAIQSNYSDPIWLEIGPSQQVVEHISPPNMKVTFRASLSDPGFKALIDGHRLRDRSARWDKVSYFIRSRVDEIVASSKSGISHRLQPQILYGLFANTVKYDAAFKCIQEAYISSDFQEAAAVIVLNSDPVGTKFAASPYWGESLVHLAGFVVNSNPSRQSHDTTFMMDGFESFEQTVIPEPGKPYHTYVRVTGTESASVVCDVYIFDDDKLIMHCAGLHFHEVENAVLDQLLGGTNTSNTTRDQPAPIMSRKEVPKPVDTTEKVEAVSNDSQSDAHVLDSILKIISKETGSDLADFQDDTLIADLGVDSIMAIEIASQVTEETGMDLLPSFIIDYPAIGDLRRVFAPKSTHISLDNDLSRPSLVDDTSQALQSSGSESFDQPPTSVTSTSDSGSIVKIDLGPDVDSPAPKIKITLLQGRPGNGRTPFYLIADGTGTIATYIHLPQFKSQIPIYGIDSPFLRCPTRFTTDVGITGAARFITEALMKAQPEGTFVLGGFSGGAMLAYEVCRQLAAANRKVDSLMLIDMCSPRSKTVEDKNDIGWAIFESISRQNGLWRSTDMTRQHLQAIFAAVATYHPQPLKASERPKRTAIIWAEKGMIDRCAGDSELMQKLAKRGIPTEPYPKFMEDSELGPVAWGLPHKTKNDLGPNGWERYVGDALCLSMPADHLEMPMPGHVHLLHEKMTRAFEFFNEAG